MSRNSAAVVNITRNPNRPFGNQMKSWKDFELVTTGTKTLSLLLKLPPPKQNYNLLSHHLPSHTLFVISRFLLISIHICIINTVYFKGAVYLKLSFLLGSYAIRLDETI